MALTATVREFIRHDGLLHLPRAALNALRPLDFHIHVIRRGDPMPEVRAPEGVTWHENALERLRQLRRGRAYLPNEFWRDKVNGASLCATLEFNGELAAVAWAYQYPARRPLMILAPGEAEITGCYTLDKFRGRGLYRMLLRIMSEWQLREHPRVFIIAASDNPTSLRTISAVGFHEVVAIRRRSLWGPKFSVSEMRVKQAFEPIDRTM